MKEQEFLERFSNEFDGHFHHYSESLFLSAATWLKAGDVAVDAGCYVGDNAYSMARCGADVLTFEPDPRLRERMELRLRSEPPTPGHISLIADALGDAPGTAEFNIVNELEGHSGLREKRHYGREVSFTRTSVTVRTLDEVLTTERKDLALFRLLKFDLEGAELHALRGARRSISEGRPLILFEFGNWDAFGVTHEDYLEYFSSHGYQIIDAFGAVIECVEALKRTIGWNLFAAPSAEAEAFLRKMIENHRYPAD